MVHVPTVWQGVDARIRDQHRVADHQHSGLWPDLGEDGRIELVECRPKDAVDPSRHSWFSLCAGTSKDGRRCDARLGESRKPHIVTTD